MWKANGYLQERIIDPNTGLKKIVSVKIKGNGLKAENDAVKRLNEKIEHATDKKIRLSEALTLYLKECEKDLKPSTVRKYDFELRSFFNIVGECYLDVLTAGYVRKKLMESGKPNRTLNGYLKEFKAFWLWAYRCDLVKSREVSDKLARFQDTPEKERIQDKYLEPGEIKQLFDNMTEKKWALLSRFQLLTGLRIGEVIAMEVTDVWGSVIRVTKTYDSNNHVVTSPKSFDSKREIHVQPELRECIEEITEYANEIKEVNGDSQLFFPDYDGGYINYASYSKYLRELSERVLNRRITPHIWRHSHASLLFSRGMSLEAVSNRLGHSDSKITKEIYLHRLEELKEKENRQLDSIHLIG